MIEMFHFDHLYSAARITHFHLARVGGGWSYADHRHPHLEFKYCVSGTLTVWIDGQMFTLHPGDAVIVKPGLYHRTEPVRDDAEFLVFHFDIEAEQIREVFQLPKSPLISAASDPERLIPAWIQRFMSEYGNALQHVSRSGKPAPHEALFLLRIQSKLLEFIGLLGETILRGKDHSDAVRGQPAQFHLAHEAAYLLEKHFPDIPGVGELANRLGVHRSYLFECFKRVYGLSPRMYVDRMRIRRAKFLLQDTPYTIEEISERLQFSSSAHFCRFFRRMTGTTPGRYRNQPRANREAEANSN